MRLRSSVRASVIVLLLCLVPAAALGAGAQAQEAFQRAVASFRAGDHAAALRSFLAARQAGLDAPALRYNLGVTYYRLQRYAEAETEFQVLSHEPRWAALAHYNLGLTAQRLGKAQEARTYFETAQRSAAEPNLRALAGVALERLAGVSPLRTGLLFSLAGGYDSSAVLPADAASLGIEGGGHDYFAEANAVATRRLSGSAAEGWNGYGALVLRKYADLSQFDLLGWQAGASRDTATAVS
jgi:tetratricopeptide (TPR) repeat protein